MAKKGSQNAQNKIFGDRKTFGHHLVFSTSRQSSSRSAERCPGEARGEAGLIPRIFLNKCQEICRETNRNHQKTIKINQKYRKDDEKRGQQKEKRTETYIKGSLIQTIK